MSELSTHECVTRGLRRSRSVRSQQSWHLAQGRKRLARFTRVADGAMAYWAARQGDRKGALREPCQPMDRPYCQGRLPLRRSGSRPTPPRGVPRLEATHLGQSDVARPVMVSRLPTRGEVHGTRTISCNHRPRKGGRYRRRDPRDLTPPPATWRCYQRSRAVSLQTPFLCHGRSTTRQTGHSEEGHLSGAPGGRTRREASLL